MIQRPSSSGHVIARFRAVDPKDIHAEIAARLREELDYELEARHMRLYGAMHAKEKGVHVPVPDPALSTRRLLTMTWMDGAPLMGFVGRTVEERNRLAHTMFRAWYVPFYRYGVIHGDPHLGNYTARPDATAAERTRAVIEERPKPPSRVALEGGGYNS